MATSKHILYLSLIQFVAMQNGIPVQSMVLSPSDSLQTQNTNFKVLKSNVAYNFKLNTFDRIEGPRFTQLNLIFLMIFFPDL